MRNKKYQPPKNRYTVPKDGHQIFLISDVEPVPKELNKPNFAFYMRSISIFNNEKYLYLFTKSPMLADDVRKQLSTILHFNIEPTKIKSANFFTNNNQDDESQTKFYIWNLPTGIYIKRLISLLVPKKYDSGFEYYDNYNFYIEIKIKQKYAKSLIPLLSLIINNLKITTDVSQIPMIYISNISQTMSSEDFEDTMKQLAPIKKIKYISEISFSKGLDRHFFLEFNQIDELNDFIKKFQDYQIDGISIFIKRLFDRDTLNNIGKYMVTIKDLTPETTPPNDVTLLRKFIESNIGPILSMKTFGEEGKLNANIIFLNPENSKKAISIFKEGNCGYTRVTLRMFNLHPEITENEIKNYFPDDFKPVSIHIYNMEQEQCWWARINFNKYDLNDTEKAKIFMNKLNRKPIGVLIPFGFFQKSGIDKDKMKDYQKEARKNIDEMKTLRIIHTAGIEINDILLILNENKINDVTYLSRKIFVDKIKNENYNVNIRCSDVEKKEEIIDDDDDDDFNNEEDGSDVEKKVEIIDDDDDYDLNNEDDGFDDQENNNSDIKNDNEKKIADEDDNKPYSFVRKDEYENIIISFGSVESKEKALEAFKNLSINGEKILVNKYEFSKYDIRMPMTKIWHYK